MHVFLIAGEASGDRLGAAVMAGLKSLLPDVSFDGVGGPLMQAQGLSSRFDMRELSVMGLAEVLPKYRHLKRRIAQMAEAVLDTKPDILLTIDSPDFCLRVARLVKARSQIRTIHYVAPSVWAWRPGRAAKMAKMIDHVLALLPFEPPLMRAHGMVCDFVGHPVVAEPVASHVDVSALREKLGLDESRFLLVLPGSRRSEVERLMPVFATAAAQYVLANPGTRLVVPVARGVEKLVKTLAADWPVAPLILDPAMDPTGQLKTAAFQDADLALAASGTVSLELAKANTPMVIAYKTHWLTWHIMRRMVKIDTVTLVNLVSETRVVPECLGPDCTPERIAQALADVARAPGAQHTAMAVTMDRLGQGGPAPGLRAAQAVLAAWDTGDNNGVMRKI